MPDANPKTRFDFEAVRTAIASPASAFGHPEAECHAAALLGLLRRPPSVELLERILVGDSMIEVDRRTCRKDQAAAEVEA